MRTFERFWYSPAPGLMLYAVCITGVITHEPVLTWVGSIGATAAALRHRW